MKVKRKYQYNSSHYDMSTVGLLKAGVDSSGGGQLEEMEANVRHLREVVADLIDRAKLSDEEVLRITRADAVYDAVKTRGDK